MVWGLWAGATRALIGMRDLQAEEVGHQPAVSGSKSEDGDLLCSAQLADIVIFVLHPQALSPCGSEVILQDGFHLSLRHGVDGLGELAACL